MNRRTMACGIIIVLLVLGTIPAWAELSRVEEATQVVGEMSEQPDGEAMGMLLDHAHAVAVFPSVVRGGLGIGGRYGKGLVLRRDKASGEWFGPHFVEIKGISYGWQIGLQSTALLLIITNERGLDSFLSNQVTLGVDVSVAAGPVGRNLEAGTDLELKSSLYSYSMSRGVFAGAALGGSVISVDDSANRSYWQDPYSPQQILDLPAAGQEVEKLINELMHLINIGKAAN